MIDEPLLPPSPPRGPLPPPGLMASIIELPGSRPLKIDDIPCPKFPILVPPNGLNVDVTSLSYGDEPGR